MDKNDGLQKVDEAEMARVEGGSSDWPVRCVPRPPGLPGLPGGPGRPGRMPGESESPCPCPLPGGPFDDMM